MALYYHLLDQAYPTREARLEAAKQHPLWEAFCAWYSYGIPDICSVADRSLFEGFVEGHKLGVKMLRNCRALILDAQEQLNYLATSLGDEHIEANLPKRDNIGNSPQQ